LPCSRTTQYYTSTSEEKRPGVQFIYGTYGTFILWLTKNIKISVAKFGCICKKQVKVILSVSAFHNFRLVQGRIQPVRLGGCFSVKFGSQVSLRVHYCTRDEVYFTTLLWWNNRRKNGLVSQMLFSELYKIMVDKVAFAGFRGRSPLFKSVLVRCKHTVLLDRSTSVYFTGNIKNVCNHLNKSFPMEPLCRKHQFQKSQCRLRFSCKQSKHWN